MAPLIYGFIGLSKGLDRKQEQIFYLELKSGDRDIKTKIKLRLRMLWL